MSLPRPTPTPSLPRPRIVPRTDLREAKTVESLFSDPAFTENRDSGIHRWVPWIAGFSAAFHDFEVLEVNASSVARGLAGA